MTQLTMITEISKRTDNLFQLFALIWMIIISQLNEYTNGGDTVRPSMSIRPIAVQLRIVAIELNLARKANTGNRVFRAAIIVASVMYHYMVECVIVRKWSSVDHKSFGFVVISRVVHQLQQYAAPGVFDCSIYLQHQDEIEGES